MKKVLKFDDDLGDFIPFFCSSCNDNVNTNVIIKVGINYYKSPLCVTCNEIRGIKIENRHEINASKIMDIKKAEIKLAVESLKPKRTRVSKKLKIFKRSSKI